MTTDNGKTDPRGLRGFCLGLQPWPERWDGTSGGGSDLRGRPACSHQVETLIVASFCFVEIQVGGRYLINFKSSLSGRSAVCMEWSSSKRTFCPARGNGH